MQFCANIHETHRELLLVSMVQQIGESRELQRVPGRTVQSSKGVRGVYTACRELLMGTKWGEDLVDSRSSASKLSFLHGKRANDAWS